MRFRCIDLCHVTKVTTRLYRFRDGNRTDRFVWRINSTYEGADGVCE